MTVREILAACRTAIAEVAAIEHQIDHLMAEPVRGCTQHIAREKVPGADEYVLKPRGTNEPAAATQQHIDGYLQVLEKKQRELTECMMRFENLLQQLDDGKARTILRYYYGIGWADEKIADVLETSREGVSRIRNRAIEYLENMSA